MVSDGVGGAIVAWEDGRSNLFSGLDVYAQRILGTGTVAAGWAADGTPLTTLDGTQQRLTLVRDGRGGAIVTWEDGREGPGNVDLYVTHITADGAIDWPQTGTSICNAAGSQLGPAIAEDGAGGAVVAWTDGRVMDSDVYAIQVRGPGATGPVLAAPLPSVVGAVKLLAVRPNPAFGTTVISFELPVRERVELDIVDVAGRRIRTLSPGDEFLPGSHAVTWDASGDRGTRVAPGIYFVRLRVAGRSDSRRIAVLK